MRTNYLVIKSINEGMDVRDCSGNRIGSVALVHSGFDDYISDWATLPISPDMEHAVPKRVLDLLPHGKMPEDKRQRLLQMGFLKIGTNPTAAAPIVGADQITCVADGVVYLSVPANRLSAR